MFIAKYKDLVILARFEIQLALLVVAYLLTPFGIKVCVDTSKRTMSIKKVCIVYGIWFCCRKKLKIDNVKQFSYEIRPSGRYKEELLCVTYKDGREKDIIYNKIDSYCCCMYYNTTIKEAQQLLNDLISTPDETNKI